MEISRFVFRGADLVLGPVAADLTYHAFGDCEVAEWPADAPLPEGVEARGLRALYAEMEAGRFALAGKAFQLLGWVRTHRFCGGCGDALRPHAVELARECGGCGSLVYPRLNPAVIVLVSRGDEVLLSRSPHFQPGMYSCQAGFVGPGESLEEAVRREVREEVGVELADVRYFGSQPWPFPNSLMIGFTARWAGGEVVRDPGEIEDVRWWRLSDMPRLPGRLSIARSLIDAWVREQGGDPDSLG